MQLITNEIIDIFNQYYHDQQQPHPSTNQKTIDYMFNHRQELSTLIDSIITVNSLPYVHYRRQFEHIPNIFGELKQISYQLIHNFNKPTPYSKLYAFLQLFDDDNKDHIITLINREISNGQHIVNDINLVTFRSNADDIQTKIDKYINHQAIHWQPTVRINRAMNFFYEIIHEQIQPIVDDYRDITTHQKIIDNPEETSWIKNIKVDASYFNGLPKYTRKFIQLNWQDYDDGFKHANNIYQLNRIMYTLNLDKDIIKIFNQVTNYLKQ